ncbi:MAG: type I-E CRISPR-associated protein Cas5/CasD [Acidobacteriota bacterium]
MTSTAAVDVLTLRLDAPLMSFGGVRIDDRGVTEAAPGLSLLTGLLANALGFDHRDFERTQRLQDRVRFAVRRDRRGERLADYQTVDLGQPWMDPGWTTWHQLAKRDGANSKGTHIRDRHYWADAVFTVALTLEPALEEPTLDAIEAALREPERPLFIGRKPCLPAGRILLGRERASTLREAVIGAPRPRSALRRDDGASLALWWPDSDAPAEASIADERQPVYDRRDWANQVHTGRRFVRRGQIAPAVEEASDDA